MKIEWRDVIGWSGIYEVSNGGAIRRTKASGRSKSGTILSGSPNGDGYIRVNLRDHGRRECRFIHELVAEAFIGPCPEGMEVNHKSTIKTDNAADNLEYMTHLENMRHMYERGIRANPTGERNGRATVTSAQVIEMRRSFAAGEKTAQEIIAETGLCKGQVYGILRRRFWKHI